MIFYRLLLTQNFLTLVDACFIYLIKNITCSSYKITSTPMALEAFQTFLGPSGAVRPSRPRLQRGVCMCVVKCFDK